jgi:hypothetical protein
MNRSIAVVLLLLLVGLVAVGFYRGWFALSSSGPAQGDNKVNVKLTVDGDKIEDDAKVVKQKTTELTESVTDSVTQSVNEATESGNQSESTPTVPTPAAPTSVPAEPASP